MLLLNQYYEGNTILINHIFNLVILIWKNEYITSKKIKHIIHKFSIFNPSDWINAIFQNKLEKAFYVLNTFQQQKYNSLVLIRSLQKDLLILLHIKRSKKMNISIFLKKNNIFLNRLKFFNLAINLINFDNYLKVMRILLKIDIKVKIDYNYDVWMDLKTLTLLLCSPIKNNKKK